MIVAVSLISNIYEKLNYDAPSQLSLNNRPKKKHSGERLFNKNEL